MDEALVQNSQDDVDHQNRGKQQQAHSPERVLKGLRRALKGALDISRQHSDSLLLDQSSRVAERRSRFEIEADGRSRKLAEVIYRKRADGRHKLRNGVEWNQFPGVGAHIKKRQLVRIVLELGQQLHDDVVLVVRRIDGADLACAEGGIES